MDLCKHNSAANCVNTAGTKSSSTNVDVTADSTSINNNNIETIAALNNNVDNVDRVMMQKRYPDEAYDLLKNLLQPDPALRVSATQALRHPFLKDC